MDDARRRHRRKEWDANQKSGCVAILVLRARREAEGKKNENKTDHNIEQPSHHTHRQQYTKPRLFVHENSKRGLDNGRYTQTPCGHAIDVPYTRSLQCVVYSVQVSI